MDAGDTSPSRRPPRALDAKVSTTFIEQALALPPPDLSEYRVQADSR
jgi:hypothetical protein